MKTRISLKYFASYFRLKLVTVRNGDQKIKFINLVKRNEWFNLLIVNPTKLSNTLKPICRLLPTNCLSVLNHVVGLVLKILSLINLLFFTFSFRSHQQLNEHNRHVILYVTDVTILIITNSKYFVVFYKVLKLQHTLSNLCQSFLQAKIV